MTSLVTPPNTTTTLTTSATYSDATLQGALTIQGAGVSIDILGAVNPGGSTVIVQNGATLEIGGSPAGIGFLELQGDRPSVKFDTTSLGYIALAVIYASPGGQSYTSPATNASVTLATDATIAAFQPGDSISFLSAAVSFTYTDAVQGSYRPTATMTVTEQSGSVVTVSLPEIEFDIKATDLVISNGSIVFRAKQPPSITGTAAQTVLAGTTIDPFAAVTVTDPHPSQVDTVQIVLNPVTGSLADPNAGTDGSTWNASTGTYTVSGLQAAVTQAVDSLVFTPRAYTLSPGQTVPTTATITATGYLGDSATNAETITIAAPPAAPVSTSRNDYDGNGTSDLMWQRSDGLIVDWSMNGATITSGAPVTSLDSSWTLLTTGDFNGDGKTDLLWQRPSDGLIVDWTMNGSSIASGGIVGRLDSSWSLIGTGDFNGDGRADLLWRNTAGLIEEWQMNGPTVSYGYQVGTLGSDWTLLGTGDFNGDGKSDLLWRNTAGSVVTWDMNGTSIIGSQTVGMADSSWTFLATADFNNDGISDVLWRQAGTGTIAEWQMNAAGGIMASAPIATLDSSWAFLGTGNFAGDGSSQIAWQSSAGAIVEWTISGLAVTAGAPVTTLDSSWKHLGA